MTTTRTRKTIARKPAARKTTASKSTAARKPRKSAVVTFATWDKVSDGTITLWTRDSKHLSDKSVTFAKGLASREEARELAASKGFVYVPNFPRRARKSQLTRTQQQTIAPARVGGYLFAHKHRKTVQHRRLRGGVLLRAARTATYCQ